MPDLWQFIDTIDADKQAMLVKRLEDRAQMPKFAEIREDYFDKIGLPLTGRILELGCGTGAVCRAIASRPGFVGTVVGSDLSAKLIEVAKDITAKSGLKNIAYHQANAQSTNALDGQYDLVLAHTVISHVSDPTAFLREAIRLAGLDWTVTTEPVHADVALVDGVHSLPVVNARALVRRHPTLGLSALGVVGDRYVPLESSPAAGTRAACTSRPCASTTSPAAPSA